MVDKQAEPHQVLSSSPGMSELEFRVWGISKLTCIYPLRKASSRRARAVG